MSLAGSLGGRDVPSTRMAQRPSDEAGMTGRRLPSAHFTYEKSSPTWRFSIPNRTYRTTQSVKS